MIRTLAVTVFAMSLTLIGCGSSSSSKKDGATDATSADVITAPKDVAPTPDTVKDTVTGDTKVDSAENDDALKLDVPAGDTRIADTAQPDAFVKLDTTPKTDTYVVVPDAPVDSAPTNGDANSDVGGDAQAD